MMAAGGTPCKHKWAKITWPKTWEPEQNLLEAGAADLIAEYKNRNATDMITHRDCQMQLLTPLQQQGVLRTREAWNAVIQDPIRGKVTMCIDTLQPHLDTNPTGNHTVELRTVEGMTERMAYYNTLLACVHTPSGQCAGTMLPAKFNDLKDRFLTATGEEHMLPQALSTGTRQDTPAQIQKLRLI
jgi:hypothetical protein